MEELDHGEFISPVFGKTRNAYMSEIERIRRLIREVPVTVFGELNRELNKRGLCLSIAELPQEPPPA